VFETIAGLSHEEIDTLGVGPGLNLLVAENVMGWRWIEPRIWNVIVSEGSTPPRRGTLSDRTKRFFVPPEKHNITEIDDWPVRWCAPGVPCYSTDETAAWDVVERMRELDWWLTLRADSFGGKDIWCVQFDPSDRERGVGSGDASAPLAICRAALKAVMSDA